VREPQFSQDRSDQSELTQPRPPRGDVPRRVSGFFDQARFALDKRLANRSALLIVKLEFQSAAPAPARIT
jgi:hypothetical protein